MGFIETVWGNNKNKWFKVYGKMKWIVKSLQNKEYLNMIILIQILIKKLIYGYDSK
jgi:hypothetical protein